VPDTPKEKWQEPTYPVIWPRLQEGQSEDDARATWHAALALKRDLWLPEEAKG
jgi:hypothetical protein